MDNDNNNNNDNNNDNDSVSDDEDSDSKQSKTTQPPRQKYCADDNIKLLKTLYTQNANDGNGNDKSDRDEGLANMTVVNFLGKPNQ